MNERSASRITYILVGLLVMAFFVGLAAYGSRSFLLGLTNTAREDSNLRHQSKQGSLYLTVLENVSNKPIVGAAVKVGRYVYRTDEKGKLIAGNLRPGKYKISIAAYTLRKTSHYTEVKAGRNSLTVNCASVFQVAEQMPALPPVPAELIRYGNRNRPKVAFTFDDGWNADYRIIELMKKSGIRGTAFLIGGRGVVTEHPELVEAFLDADFEICTHGYKHLKNTDLSDAQLKEEITKGQSIITKLTGKRVNYYRPSGGTYDKRTISVITSMGYYPIFWSVDSLDTRSGLSTAQRAASILSDVENGDIILFHLGGNDTYDLVSVLIPELLAKGYEIGTVSDVLEP